MTEILAFTADHIRRLTGLSARQLGYWDKTGFFPPTLLDEYRPRAFSRVYSFRDVVGLRVIGVLRRQYNIPLQELRRVGAWLQKEFETPWASLRFRVVGRHVIFVEPKTGTLTEPSGEGQRVMSVAVEPIANEMREAASKLRDREPEQIGRVARNRYVVHNAWVVAGTRIPTTAVWNYYAAGYSIEQIIEEYPRLTPEDVRSAIEFEADRQHVA